MSKVVVEGGMVQTPPRKNPYPRTTPSLAPFFPGFQESSVPSTRTSKKQGLTRRRGVRAPYRDGSRVCQWEVDARETTGSGMRTTSTSCLTP